MKRRFFCFGLLATLLPWKRQESTSTSTTSKNSALSDQTIKQLHDDESLGGLAVPIEFDDVIIHTPIVNGELKPLLRFKTSYGHTGSVDPEFREFMLRQFER